MSDKGSFKRRRFWISPLFLLLGVIMFFLGEGYGFVIYSTVTVLHELAHAEVSNRLGYSLISLKLMPYGATLTGNYEGVKYRDEICIALAGPLFNLLLCVPSVALWYLVPNSYLITRPFVFANVFIAIFNFIPVFPMDGGRILLAVLSRNSPRNKAYKKVRLIGIIFSLFFCVLFVLSLFYRLNISIGIVAVFMLVSTIIPDKNSYYGRIYSMAFKSERIKNGIVVKEIMVDCQTSLLKLNKMLNPNYFTKFLIVDRDFNYLFTLNENDLENLLVKSNPNDKIGNIIKNTRCNEISQRV